jgi:glutamate racemase
MNFQRPRIGVFDSGFGGLTVLKELLAQVPGADYLYFGDTARLPYGSKSVETVARYAVEATQFLEGRGANLLVIACNTATALALNRITQAAHVPVVGVVEPGAEQASAASKKGRVVVIGTEATVSSHAYRKALERRGIEAREKACPLLVPLVEEGWVEHPVTEQVAQIYLHSMSRLWIRRTQLRTRWQRRWAKSRRRRPLATPRSAFLRPTRSKSFGGWGRSFWGIRWMRSSTWT